MSQKRKDTKGRVLKQGESQRSDGRYMFRYTTDDHKRYTIYAPTLAELRSKEDEIMRDRLDGINNAKGETLLVNQLHYYCSLKRNMSWSTKESRQFMIRAIERDPISQMPIKSIKKSDAKEFVLRLSDYGYYAGTIRNIRNMAYAAMATAVDDDIIRKNPFSFPLQDLLDEKEHVRQALSPEVKERFLEFVKTDACASKYYDEIVILLGTGLRIGELYGLTFSDVDLDSRVITVNKQLRESRTGEYHIEDPKTSSGKRCVPIQDDVLAAFKRVYQSRRNPKVEYMVDGYCGFIFLTNRDKPKLARHLEAAMRRMVDRYNKHHQDSLPTITPHILRHTFATELANSGINLKALQYLMGHKNAMTTLNVYAHNDFDRTKEAFFAIRPIGNSSFPSTQMTPNLTPIEEESLSSCKNL